MVRPIVGLGLIAVTASGQSAPAFEAATIKKLSAPVRSPGIEIHDGSVIVTGWGLRSLIAEAYGVKEFQAAGGPDWLSRREDVYEIEANARNTPSNDQVRAMAQ